MTQDQRELLDHAADSNAAARLLLAGGYPGFAASRAYYATFYAAEALLEAEGSSSSKHSAVIAAFGRQFVQTGKVQAQFHRYLIEAQNLRQTGDYGERGAVSPDAASEQVRRAQEFLDVARRLLGMTGGPPTVDP